MDVTRRSFLGQCASWAAAGRLLRGDLLDIDLPARRPNIVLIMADDLGFEALRCYGGDVCLNGNKPYQTPRLDALAAQGVRFTHAYAQPLCTPSRVEILTGQYNFRNYTRFGELDPRQATFAHVLGRAGYATAIAGKWQLYGGGAGVYPDRAGFDEYCLWSLETPGDRYADPTYRINGVLHQDVAGAYGPDVFTDFGLDFITRHQDQPFLFYYPMCLTHSPFVPTPDTPGWPANKDDNSTEYFADMVAYMDKCVGRIVDHLDQLGLRENTVIMFTGDNGTSQLISSRMQDGTVVDGGKGYTSDAGTHVAFIANWPGTAPEGLVVDHLLDFSDVLPTLAELGAAALPENVIDGRSFAPLLQREPYTPRAWTFCWCDPRMSNDKYSLRVYARDQRWKLYDSGELYDVPADRLEQSPLAPGTGGAEAQAARARLQAVLDAMGYRDA